MRKAIIDIGTNTFNLLVVEYEETTSFKILHEVKLPVKLGKGSMNDGILKPDAIERAVYALKQHINKAHEFGADEIKAFATSAVRSAKNKDDFIFQVKEATGLKISIISGDREAELIYYGVKMAVPMKKNVICLILDIGGGSNEFIICDHQRVLWKNSYNLGMARLLEKIEPHDPLTEGDIMKLKSVTDALIHDLVEKCRYYKPAVLIGASGSFETYASMILHEKTGSDAAMKGLTAYEIGMDDFYKLHDKLIHSTSAERLKMPGLPEWRIEMIALAISFTKYIVDKFSLNKIFFSDYALKEGVVGEVGS